jgi:hypothetical protein
MWKRGMWFFTIFLRFFLENFQKVIITSNINVRISSATAGTSLDHGWRRDRGHKCLYLWPRVSLREKGALHHSHSVFPVLIMADFVSRGLIFVVSRSWHLTYLEACFLRLLGWTFRSCKKWELPNMTRVSQFLMVVFKDVRMLSPDDRHWFQPC